MNLHPAVGGVIAKLAAAGHQAYVVGGCVRDLLTGREPKDWDVATSARPDQVSGLFPGAIPTGVRYGTLLVRDRGVPIEITTFRTEGVYLDRRHPSDVRFVSDIKLDLARRDFTCNAIAMNLEGEVIDPFDGRGDIARGLIRAVGEPARRFHEDALRMMRAIRFACQLGWTIEDQTFKAIKECARLISEISMERVGEELVKMLMAQPRQGSVLLQESGLLAVIFPELQACIGVEQNRFHRYDVWMHTLETLSRVKGDIRVRLAALFHDVGKPVVLTVGEDGRRRFYGHDKVGAEMTATMMKRLRFGNDLTTAVVRLVRNHMRLHHLIDSTHAAKLRLIRDVGRDLVPLLVDLARADVLAKGDLQEVPPKQEGVYRELVALASDESSPIDLRRLAIDGRDVMEELKLPPGPQVGRILERLLDKVMETPELNNRQDLLALLRGPAGDTGGHD